MDMVAWIPWGFNKCLSELSPLITHAIPPHTYHCFVTYVIIGDPFAKDYRGCRITIDKSLDFGSHPWFISAFKTPLGIPQTTHVEYDYENKTENLKGHNQGNFRIIMAHYVENLVKTLEQYVAVHKAEISKSVTLEIRSTNLFTMIIYRVDTGDMLLSQYLYEYEDVLPWTCLSDIRNPADKRLLFEEAFENITACVSCVRPQINIIVDGKSSKLVG